jgi:hypothetical protein
MSKWPVCVIPPRSRPMSLTHPKQSSPRQAGFSVVTLISWLEGLAFDECAPIVIISADTCSEGYDECNYWLVKTCGRHWLRMER